MLEALYDEGESVGADLADCVRGARPDFGLVSVEVPEPGAERPSLPGGLTIRHGKTRTQATSAASARSTTAISLRRLFRMGGSWPGLEENPIHFRGCSFGD